MVNGAFGVTGDLTSYICLQGPGARTARSWINGPEETLANDYEVWQGDRDGAFAGRSSSNHPDGIGADYW